MFCSSCRRNQTSHIQFACNYKNNVADLTVDVTKQKIKAWAKH